MRRKPYRRSKEIRLNTAARGPLWARLGYLFLASFGAALLFLLLGPYSNFGPTGYLDPWFYTGYFTHFSYLLRHDGITYYVSRLPWILPGWLMFRLAPPAAATVLLNALILASALTALFRIVDRRYGRWAAALACVALATNPYFIYSVSWDYPDGPAISYALCALACFLCPSSGRIPNAVWGGVFLALSGYTNLAGLPVLLGIAAIPVWRYGRALLELLRESARAIAGAAAITVVLAIASKFSLGTYLFFMPQIGQIIYTRTHAHYLSDMWGTGYAWIPGAYRLGAPLFLLVVGALAVVRRCKQGALIESYVCLAVSSVLFAAFEFGLHNTGLRVAYQSSYLVAPMFAFAGLLLAEHLPASRAVRVALLLFGLALPFSWSRWPLPPKPEMFWPAIALLTLGAAALWKRPAACGLILAALFCGPASDSSLGYIWKRQNDAAFQTMMRLESTIDARLAPGRSVRFWFEPHQPASNLFDSACSLYLWPHVDTAKGLSPDDRKALTGTATTLVHLSLNRDSSPERDTLLAAQGFRVENERRSTAPSSLGTIYIVLQDVEAMPAAPDRTK